MKPYADYYAQIDATHQRQIDNQAGYEDALAREIERVKRDLDDKDDDTMLAVQDYIESVCIELITEVIAIGAGDYEELDKQRECAIKHIAAKRIDERMNDYDPD